jgi:hypothetical protein
MDEIKKYFAKIGACAAPLRNLEEEIKESSSERKEQYRKRITWCRKKEKNDVDLCLCLSRIYVTRYPPGLGPVA